MNVMFLYINMRFYMTRIYYCLFFKYDNNTLFQPLSFEKYQLCDLIPIKRSNTNMANFRNPKI